MIYYDLKQLRRNIQNNLFPFRKERPMGIEPTTEAWEAAMLPLHQGRVKQEFIKFQPKNFDC